MTTWVRDVRYAVRLLGRQPSFTIVAVLVLALGIGANSAVFSIVNALLLKPRAGHPAGEIVQIFSRDTTKPDVYRAFSYPNYADLKARTDLFASLTAHTFAMAGLEQDGRTKRVFVDVTTAGMFDTFGVRLALGRPFTEAEERPGANQPVAILSYPAWQRMGGATDVVGHTLRLNGKLFTIVGVAPQGFGGSLALVTPEMWVPTGVYDAIANDFALAGLTGTLADRRHYALVVVAQLQPNATISTIMPALTVAGERLASAYPAENRNQAFIAAALSRMSVSTSPGHEGPLVTVAISLLIMSGLILLIASFNLANMLLARGAARRREFAVRTAIGGGRWRLTRQLVTEGFVLALAGGAAGLLLSTWATKSLVAALSVFSPVALSFDATPDLRGVAATIAFCAASTMVFSLGPALRLARTDLLTALRDRASDVGSGRRRLRLQHLLVMGQLALSLVMLTIGGLFLRSALAAASIDPGFTFERGVLAHVDAALGGLSQERVRELYPRILQDLRRRPDVAAASVASLIPFGDIDERADVQKAGAALPSGNPGIVSAVYTSIGSHYFDTLGLSMIAGRDFTTTEEQSAGAAIAIIDAPLAAKLFATGDPIGQMVQYAVRASQAPLVLRVVGVAPGIKQDMFDTSAVPHVYLPFGREPRADAYLHVRTAAPTADAEAALLPSLRRTIEAPDRALPVLSIETRASYRDNNLVFALIRVGASVFLVFAAVALVLAAVGVYGVKAYVVSTRTPEIGLRIALGATPASVVWTVVREGLLLSSVGLGAGLLLSILASIGMRSMTLQANIDLPTIGGAIVVLATAAIAASWIPARRASRVEPTVALRSE